MCKSFEHLVLIKVPIENSNQTGLPFQIFFMKVKNTLKSQEYITRNFSYITERFSVLKQNNLQLFINKNRLGYIF